MTTINDILLAKGTHVHTILESAAVLDLTEDKIEIKYLHDYIHGGVR